MTKKIIFIGGTARSGSTLLDLILGNDPKAMSLGEILALFRPWRKHHFEKIAELKKDKIWAQILKNGEKNLFDNLVNFFPHIDYFIDSSKEPFWINYHIKKNKGKYDIHNILIFKTPAEFAKSFIKRGRESDWVWNYIHYHRIYLSLIHNFKSFQYKDIFQNNNIETLCNNIGIPYFETKTEYWNKKQSIFFGSNSVKTEEALSADYQLEEQNRKSLNYDGVNDTNLLTAINKEISLNPNIKNVEKTLTAHLIDSKSTTLLIQPYSKPFRILIRLKQKAYFEFRRLFPYDYFKK